MVGANGMARVWCPNGEWVQVVKESVGDFVAQGMGVSAKLMFCFCRGLRGSLHDDQVVDWDPTSAAMRDFENMIPRSPSSGVKFEKGV